MMIPKTAPQLPNGFTKSRGKACTWTGATDTRQRTRRTKLRGICASFDSIMSCAGMPHLVFSLHVDVAGEDGDVVE
jgi:hypothetical protein